MKSSINGIVEMLKNLTSIFWRASAACCTAPSAICWNITADVTAASAAMPPWQATAKLIKSEVDGNCVRLTTRRQSGSGDRRKSNRLDSTSGRHPIPQASQLFKPQSRNGGVKGQGPLRSLGGTRGPFSHVREWPPYTPKRTRGEIPSTPDIGSLQLE